MDDTPKFLFRVSAEAPPAGSIKAVDDFIAFRDREHQRMLDQTMKQLREVIEGMFEADYRDGTGQSDH